MATAGFAHVRLHGRARGYRDGYGEAELADWAGWAFFDNTEDGDAAPRNAQRPDELLAATDHRGG